MANRYTVLNKQQETKLLKGCPVLIDAIGITKDEKTGQVLAQVKLQNLSPKAIIGCKIRIEAFEISKEPLEGVDSFSYLDMTVKQGEFFGSQNPVNLPDNRTRQIKVSVSEVVFEDQAIWKYETGVWETPPSQDNLFPNDDELLKEYTLEVGGNVRLEPEIWNGFFLCTCGAINLEGQACYKCKRTYEALFSPLLNEEDLRENARERKKEAQYQEGLRLKERQNLEDVEKAKGIFASLADYKDSDEQVYACKRQIEEIKAKEEADRLERENQAEERRIAAEKAAKKRRRIAITTSIVVGSVAFVIILITIIIPKQKLNKAMALIDSGDYEAGYALLTEIGNTDAIASSKYDRAMVLIDSGDYEAGYALLTEIGNSDAIASNKYDRAMALIDSKDYEAAYALLNGLHYKDSETIRKKLEDSDAWLYICPIGDTVFFGAYEQDNNTSNGKEDVEWIVLARENGRILVISRFALDCQQYNTSDNNVTWENCSLRKWLNESFLNSAFSKDERAMIPSVTVNSAVLGANLGSNPYADHPISTTDQVFLLSEQELDKYHGVFLLSTQEYFGVGNYNAYNAVFRCQGTAYCYAKGGFKTSTGGYTLWWLRGPNNECDYFEVYVDDYGHFNECAYNVRSGNITVRPALWIDLGS